MEDLVIKKLKDVANLFLLLIIASDNEIVIMI